MKHFVTTTEFARRELEAMLDRAAEYKSGKRRDQPLAGKAVAMLYANPSLRTRVTMERAVALLGGQPMTMSVGADTWSLEHREGAVMDADKTEHIRDAVRVLSRVACGIGVRCFPRFADRAEDKSDAIVEAFRRHATVPVLNLESALRHPFQAMADALTVRERWGRIEGVKVALTWVWHPKAVPASVANSFVAALSALGASVTVAAPKGFPLDVPATVVDDQAEALRGAQVVYAKSWASPLVYESKDAEAAERAKHRSWRVDEERMKMTADGIFLHCLPVRRNVEVTDGVLDGPASRVVEQAENRLWAQMGVLSTLLG